MNIVQHLLDLTKAEFDSEAEATPATDEIFASQQLFEIFKAFKNSYFGELHSFHSLEFANEYDDIIDEEQSNDESDNFEEDQDPDIGNHFTLEDMENIIEWVDQHPNYTVASILNRFRKIKSMPYIERFRKYTSQHGSKHKKLNKVKEFMLNEFYINTALKKK